MILRIESLFRTLSRGVSINEWMLKLLGYYPDTSDHSTSPENDTTAQHRQRRQGLVMVQIDGLSQKELRHALQAGELPFLNKLLNSEHYHLHPMYSGLPSSTPAVQAELFYGVKGAVPAFAFKDRKTGQLHKMYDSDSAAAIENQIKKLGVPLLSNGSAYCNIYTGGASESHFCASAMGWGDMAHSVKPLSWLIIAILNIPTLVRMVALLFIELFIGIADFFVGLYRGKRFIYEFKFIAARVAISILLRDLITIGSRVDIARGLPIVHLNYIGYDEQAHRRGPSSGFSHWTLRGIDKSIERIWNTCHQSRNRQYELWVYSDHGQESTTPFEKHTGQSISDAVNTAYRSLKLEPLDKLHVVSHRIAHQRSRLLGFERIKRLVRKATFQRHDTDMQFPDVVAMGPVGHVYLKHKIGFENRKLLANRLVKLAAVPMALYCDDDNEICVSNAAGTWQLPADSVTVFGKDHHYREQVTEDIIKLCQHKDAGDVVLLAWSQSSTVLSFPFENGAHAGPGPLETDAFALLPADTELDSESLDLNADNAIGIMRPIDLRNAALHLLGREPLESRTRVGKRYGTHESILRVMTYNVHSCIGMDGKTSPERIARVIARYQPDVVALQELDVARLRSNLVDQVSAIANELEMKYHFHPAINIDNEQYGDAILTRLPLRHRHAGVLPGHPAGHSASRKCEPRGALWVTVDFNGIDVQIINTHLGLNKSERLAQVKALVGPEWLDNDECKGPVVFCGDLNALSSSEVLKILNSRLSDVQSAMMQHKPKNTFSGRVPIVRIDHILTDNIKQVVKVEVPATTLTRIASDHLPLIADLVIEATT